MSPETGQLLIFGAVSASALANAATAYALWRDGRGAELRVVHLSPVADPGFHSDTAGGSSTAVRSAHAPDFVPETGLRSNSHGGSGLQAVRQRRGSEEVLRDDPALFSAQSAACHCDLVHGDRNGAGVDHLDPHGPGSAGRQQQAHESNPQSHAVASDRPVGVEDAERGADYGNTEGDPADPIHGRQHSAPLAAGTRGRKPYEPPARSTEPDAGMQGEAPPFRSIPASHLERELLDALLLCRDSYDYVRRNLGLPADPVIAKCDAVIAKAMGASV